MVKDILSKIVEDKKQEIAVAKQHIPESFFREKAFAPRKRRPFLKKLEQPGPCGINIIAEIKRASPSKGDIRANLNPAVYAGEYEKGGAAALSVLTDRTHFKGGPEDLKIAREATTIPVLRKDFLISAYQIFESAVMEADAVLLIVRILDQQQLKDYLSLCNELKMDALVEVHSEADIEKAGLAGARLIGINNRNLQSFETDIEIAIRMKSLLNNNQIAIAASGIRTRKDIEKIRDSEIWNFLIGESLVRAEHPREVLESLHGK
ncbi:MAG: indole-3-glycerol phosphate synthase TrpC [Desulfobacterales bacterium]|nr:indole-3-glycerol phosphate synthase TrpC [Desulfobacterales bacterium]